MHTLDSHVALETFVAREKHRRGPSAAQAADGAVTLGEHGHLHTTALPEEARRHSYSTQMDDQQREAFAAAVERKQQESEARSHEPGTGAGR